MSQKLVRFSVIAALALVPLLAGCGATDEDVEAQYPNNAAVGSSDESLQGLPPGAAVNSQGDVASANDAYARGFAAGQQASENPGNADGTVVIGDTGDSADSEYSDTDPSALTDFRSTLDPYGTWVDDDTYGTVWVPSSSVVGSDFQPYVTSGHWVYDDDYVWVSDYEWGWVPFHYGRWILSPRGWAWIPGRAYSGAWVSWRMGYGGYGYLGWAPLAPTWYWRGGYAYGLYYASPSPYAYCPNDHVFAPGGPRGYVVGGSMGATVAANTRPYVPASPSVNGHVGANPTVNGARGPQPSALGLAPSQVPHSNGSSIGLARAKGFATPQSARTFGAHAPSTFNAGTASHGALPAHSSLAPIATGPRYIGGPQYVPSRVPWSGPSQSFARPSPSFAQPSQSFARPSQPSTFQGRSFDSHTFSSHPSAFSNGMPHSSPSYSSGFSPHSSFSSSPSFHSSASPSFHSSASPSFHAPSAPAYHPSSHTSFSGGGHVGGGGRGGHR
ncbi:MAG: DUF6600 domain-containing protein [Polyangiaceae bacterium]